MGHHISGGESFSGGNPGAPSGGRDGAGGDKFATSRPLVDWWLKRKKKAQTLATATEDVRPESNIGNVSGLGGKRDVTGLGIMQRRKARGASLANLVPSLAETTRRALFGI